MSKKYYIKAEDLRQEYERSLASDYPTPKLIQMFTLIAERYSTIYNNVGELDRNSTINYAVAEAYQKWKEYDPTKSDNIFAFYTQMIKNDLTTEYNRIFKNSHRNISIDALFTKNEH